MKLNPAALYQAMQSKGLTQKQLAKLTGLSQPGISQYLAGTCSPGASALDRLATALGIPVSALCEVPAKDQTVRHLSVQDAARCLGVSPTFVRRGLQTDRLDIGCAVRIKMRWRYFISSDKLRAMAGDENFEKYMQEANKNG